MNGFKMSRRYLNISIIAIFRFKSKAAIASRMRLRITRGRAQLAKSTCSERQKQTLDDHPKFCLLPVLRHVPTFDIWLNSCAVSKMHMSCFSLVVESSIAPHTSTLHTDISLHGFTQASGNRPVQNWREPVIE